MNRYDGIDLPDDLCRILIFDSRPYTENLSDLYQELCRPESEATLMRTVRNIEQGMGRSVRGERDYCVVIAIGSDLVRMLRSKATRKYFSSQMAAQIDLGLEIATMAKQGIEEGNEPREELNGLVRQCLRRDSDWKAFYAEQMDQVVLNESDSAILEIYAAELKAEEAHILGDYGEATQTLQSLLDGIAVKSDADKGWYLQDMARYCWRDNRVESNRLQVAAHKINRLLLKPPSGVTVAKLNIVSQHRIEKIAEWVRDCGGYSQLDANVTDILSNLAFGVKADKFENALNELSRALGFIGERPDKEWKEGPDNLWALDSTQYLLWECKNEVDVTRAVVNKRETEQVNRSSAWFAKHYPGLKVKRLMVHPTHKIQSAAALTHEVEVVREAELRKFVKSIREFFKSFESLNFRDLSTDHIQRLVDAHHLSVCDFLTRYSRKIYNCPV